jgi:type I restriction enzyme R subunit
LQARIGSLTANQEWFKVWRTIDGQHDARRECWSWRRVARGVREIPFLDLLQHFITFEEDGLESDRSTRSSRAIISSTP